MARLRRRGNLVCFYCGKRSSVKFDENVRDFLCMHCDATNYLDKNGEITDPPVAKTSSLQQPTQYATGTSHLATNTAASSQQQSIFCATCLKNQHLFAASLAQYLPEDPDHPEYSQLENNYYNFRQRLEERYPQICAECEPRVLAQVSQAGYTARTDHLRRMMDRSRQRLATPKKRTWLDAVSGLGRALWLAALACQLLWHLAAVAHKITAPMPHPLRDPDERPHRLTSLVRLVVVLLPNPPLLISLSMWSGIASCWWNPKFAQVFRGFSRHILGLGQWYAFQALTIAVRVIVWKFTGHAQGMTAAELSLHGFVSLAVVIFGVVARNCVRVDTTPLFHTGASPVPSSPKSSPPIHRKAPARNGMSHLLDEILDEPQKSTAQQSSPPPVAVLGIRDGTQDRRRTNAGPQMGSLGLADRAAAVQYSHEMDWSPTSSTHRAFSDFGPSGRDRQGFNQSPIEPAAGPFWYKIPPAPTTPALRARPSSQTLLRENAASKQSTSFHSDGTSKMSEVDLIVPQHGNPAKRKVSFAQPSFFAQTPSNANDPRSSLADLLGSTFNIQQDEAYQEPAMDAEEAERPIELELNHPTAGGLPGVGQIASLMLAALSFGAWVWSAMGERRHPRRESMLLSMAVGVMVAAHMMEQSLRSPTTKGLSRLSVISAVACAVQIVGGCVLFAQIWMAPSEDEALTCSFLGTVLLGSMLAIKSVNSVFA